MTQQKSFKSPMLSAFSLSLGLIIVTGFLPNVSAQPESVNQSQIIGNNSIAQVTFEPPKDGKPDDTAEGASRGDRCSQEIVAVGGCVTPLVPTTKNRLTVAEHPTFFIYVPETTAKEIFFGLIDENNNFHYQTKIPTPSKSGILSFKLPDDAPPLEIDKNYRWTFVVIGQQGLRPDSLGVIGEIRRIRPTSELMSLLENKPLLERAALYGQNGIWYDTLASLAEARRSEPGNATLTATWQEFLNSVGLEAIAAKPLLN